MTTKKELFGLKELEIASNQVTKWGRNVYPFFDNAAAERFRGHSRQELLSIHAQVMAQAFEFSSFYSLAIPKPTGGTRELALPRTKDEMVAQAAINLITPILAAKIPKESFAYQIAPSEAPDEIFAHWGKCYSDYLSVVDDCFTLNMHGTFVKTDITNFYSTIQQNLLLLKISESIHGQLQLLQLISKLLNYRIARADGSTVSGLGLPTGPAYSHFLANFYLADLDRKWADRSVLYARYVDDVVAVFDTETEAESFLEEYDQDLTQLGLARNHQKTRLGAVRESGDFVDELKVKKYRIGLLSLQGGDEEEEEQAEETFRELFGLALIDFEEVEEVSTLAPHLRFILRQYGDTQLGGKLVNVSYESLKLGSTDPVGVQLALLSIVSEEGYFLDDRFQELMAGDNVLVQLLFLRLIIENHDVHTPDRALLDFTYNVNPLVRNLAFSALATREVQISPEELDKILTYQIHTYSGTDSMQGVLMFLAITLKRSHRRSNEFFPILISLATEENAPDSRAVIDFLSEVPDRELLNLLWRRLLINV